MEATIHFIATSAVHESLLGRKLVCDYVLTDEEGHLTLSGFETYLNMEPIIFESKAKISFHKDHIRVVGFACMGSNFGQLVINIENIYLFAQQLENNNIF